MKHSVILRYFINVGKVTTMKEYVNDRAHVFFFLFIMVFEIILL